MSNKVFALVFSLLFGCSTVSANPMMFFPFPGTSEGSSDASTAIQLQDFLLVGDDESNNLRLYPQEGGQAVREWRLKDLGAKLKKELDVEASVLVGKTLYVIGSHSHKSKGKPAQEHSGHIISLQIDGTAPDLRFSQLQQFSSLADLFVQWDENNLHGYGANHLGFQKALMKGQVPESIQGFSIEGLTTNAAGKQLLIGFRAPLVFHNNTWQAILVPLMIPTEGISTIQLNSLKPPILLDLGGRGVRDLYLLPDGEYLILAGPSTATDFTRQKQFALFHWQGTIHQTPQLLADDLEQDLLDFQGSFEAIASARFLENTLSVLLLMDNGDTLIDGIANKKLSPALQKFYGVRREIGWPMGF